MRIAIASSAAILPAAIVDHLAPAEAPSGKPVRRSRISSSENPMLFAYAISVSRSTAF
jgi:hypothetical protein